MNQLAGYCFKWNKSLGMGLTTLALVLMMGAAVGANENLVVNGDAEAATAVNWTGLTVTSSDAHSGKQCFSRTGNGVIFSKAMIPIDPKKTYRLTGWFKSTGEKPSKIYFGFAPADAKKRSIASYLVNAVKGTQTTLAEDCSKESLVLKVKDASKWNANKYNFVAFDVDANYKDLPNRKVSSMGITKVTHKGDVWEVQLAKPCGVAASAGTAIRIHRSGSSYMYTAAANKLVPKGNWVKFSATVHGKSPRGLSYKRWWVGTRYAQILILANYGQKKEATLLVDDVTLVEEKAK